MSARVGPDNPATPAGTRLLVVIVNYRTARLVEAGLRALRDELHSLQQLEELERAEVVVVDSGSADGSAEHITTVIEREGWSSWCGLLALEDNVGFAAGNNAAIEPALASDAPPDFVLLLNPDTEVRPGAVHRLLAHLRASEEVGIAGSRLEGRDGAPQESAFGFPSPTSELLDGLRIGLVERLLARHRVRIVPQPEEPGPVDWVAGASMMIRRRVFEEIGLLDEGYFLYYEEVDFCLAARRAGWPTHFVPESRVVHLVGTATQVTGHRAARPRRPRYWFESRTRFFDKNFGKRRRLTADLAFAAGLTLFRMRQKFQRKPACDPPHLGRDFVRHAFLPEIGRPERRVGRSRGRRPAVETRGAHNENPPDIGLWELLREDFETYDRNPWLPGLWVVALHRLGNARMSVRWLPARLPLSVAYRMTNRVVEVATGIEVPYTVHLGRRVRIWHHGGVVIHAEAIGDDVVLRHNTTIGITRLGETRLPVIRDGVELGVGATVLGDVVVGKDAVVGASSLVLDDVAPGATVVGIPARPVDHSRPPSLAVAAMPRTSRAAGAGG